MRGVEELHIVQTCSGRNISFRCSNEASLTGFDLVDERTSSGAVRDIFSRCFPVDLCSHAAAAFEIATDRLITIFKTAPVGSIHHAGSRTLDRNIPVGRLGGPVRHEFRPEHPVTGSAVDK